MKKFLLLTISILFVAAACNKQVAVQPVPKQETGNSNQQTDTTANWKTYTNSKYGFEFNYPNDVTASSNNEIITFAGKNSEFSVSIQNSKLQSEFVSPVTGSQVKLPKTLINGRNWYTVTPIDGGGAAFIMYETDLGSKTLEINFPSYTKGWADKLGDNQRFYNKLAENKSLQNQILSTFKFTK
ncbi:MAG TPA: PsbP-related protein [Patescibacteria group bacterium]